MNGGEPGLLSRLAKGTRRVYCVFVMHSPKLTVVFDNEAGLPGARYGWGFACLIETADRTILFDTGPEGKALMANLRLLKVEPAAVDAVFISHDHWDHVDGLPDFLDARPGVDVHVPKGVSSGLVSRIRRNGGNPIAHGAALEIGDYEPLPEIAPDVFTTGAVTSSPVEHSLIIATKEGPIVITGCCHQGVVRLAGLVTERFRGPIRILCGGLHLFRETRREAAAIAIRLKEMGIRRIAPMHCTGKKAATEMVRVFGDDISSGGVGAVIDL